jgi:uncharacterized protein (TIGR00251 family)
LTFSTATQSIVIQVKVKPNSRTSTFEQSEEGVWLAQIKSPPVDGRANQDLIQHVAKDFRCAKSAVSIKSGASARTKLIRVQANPEVAGKARHYP